MHQNLPKVGASVRSPCLIWVKLVQRWPQLNAPLALEPRHFVALEGLVLIFDDAGLYEEAFEILHRIEAIHPHAEILSKARARLEAKTLGQAL